MKELEPPTTLSHYRIVSRLGADGRIVYYTSYELNDAAGDLLALDLSQDPAKRSILLATRYLRRLCHKSNEALRHGFAAGYEAVALPRRTTLTHERGARLLVRPLA